MLVNGQQHGGIAQGIAQALWDTFITAGTPTRNSKPDGLSHAVSLRNFLALKFPTPKPLALGTPWAQRNR